MTRALAPESLLLSLLPLALLIFMLAGCIVLFGDETTGGPAQVSMIIAGVAAALIGMFRGTSWSQLEAGTAVTVSRAMPIIMIILVIGMLIGLWIVAGVIPLMIYYGLLMISPDVFYLAALFLSSVVALATGSSWSTAGTVGVVLVAVAEIAGLSPAICAGAVISGAYFGDKLSPLSDTTNLAAGMTATPLFEHIRNMLWTTVPAYLIAIVGFSVLSAGSHPAIDIQHMDNISSVLSTEFNLTPWLLLPVLVTFGMAAFRTPAFLALLTGGLAAAMVGFGTQPGIQDAGLNNALIDLGRAAATGVNAETGNAELNALLSRGGMASMLPTIWLIISAMFFGGMMEHSGCLGDIVRLLLKGAKTGAALMLRAGLTSFASNIITPDQFLSLAMPAQMYNAPFREHGLKSRNLSRVLEDFGTATSPLVPWNTCGAYMAGALGVMTIAYLPFCFFNLASPLVSTFFILMNWRVDYEESEPTPPSQDVLVRSEE